MCLITGKTYSSLRKGSVKKRPFEIIRIGLEMDRAELNKLLTDCDYSEYFIKKASDLQIIEAVLNCYENYKALKKGKIEINKIPENKN